MEPGYIVALVAIIFGCSIPILIVAIISFNRQRDNAELQKTVRTAIEKGETLPPEFIDSLQRAVPRAKTPMNDVRAGLILMAIAGGCMAADYFNGAGLPFHMSGFAAVPGLIGVALLILGIIGLNTRKS